MTISADTGRAVELRAAIAAVREAALLCGTVQACIAVEKTDRSPVTVADFGSQALVCRRIRDAFPRDPIVAEEDAVLLRSDVLAPIRNHVVDHVEILRPGATSADVLGWIDIGSADGRSDRFWTLDPIDGTKGFLRGGHYAIALALVERGSVQVAALACPHLRFDGNSSGCVFAAAKGGGVSWLPAQGAAAPRPVAVSTVADPHLARFCESVESGHSAHGWAAAVADRLGLSKAPVRLDSQTKYAVVASGQADIYLRLPARPGYHERIWDHAPGALVVEEAGGRVTDIAGRPLDLTRGSTLEANRGIVATNGHLHDAVLEAIAAATDT